MPLACQLPEALILLMVTWEGLEPPTLWFVAKYSNPAELPGHDRLRNQRIL